MRNIQQLLFSHLSSITNFQPVQHLSPKIKNICFVIQFSNPTLLYLFFISKTTSNPSIRKSPLPIDLPQILTFSYSTINFSEPQHHATPTSNHHKTHPRGRSRIRRCRGRTENQLRNSHRSAPGRQVGSFYNLQGTVFVREKRALGRGTVNGFLLEPADLIFESCHEKVSGLKKLLMVDTTVTFGEKE